MSAEVEHVAPAQALRFQPVVGDDQQPYVALFGIYDDTERLITTLPAEDAARLGLAAVQHARAATDKAVVAEWLRAELKWPPADILRALIELDAIGQGYSVSQLPSITAGGIPKQGAPRRNLVDRFLRWAIGRRALTRARRAR